MKHICYIICHVLLHYLLFITLSANFRVTLSGPISLHYRAILLHYQSVVTLSVNLVTLSVDVTLWGVVTVSGVTGVW